MNNIALFQRELVSRYYLSPMVPRYCIAWEDPAEPEAPMKITYPAPRWLAMALAGGYLPPVDTYLRDAERSDGERLEHPYAPPIGPMTEEQAMEYLLQMVIPRRVWGEPTNRPRFAIVRCDMIPADPTHRNAWRLADFTTRAAA